MSRDDKEAEEAGARLRPFLDGDLRAWAGLPGLSLATLSAVLGQPSRREETKLGWYDATRYTFEAEAPSGGLAAYIRGGAVVMIEALKPPPASAAEGLGEPCAVKPHEILVEGAYVHEYLYCERGLVLSVAEPFDKAEPSRLVRCRGLRPLAGPEEFGPEFYMAFEERVVW
ncbi:MAG TPA: hypothetical protein VN282_24445 [Pyrinomonadaceae bacterium]|nr:hypothetical protein [Pyrinomonadaceae bacterium]